MTPLPQSVWTKLICFTDVFENEPFGVNCNLIIYCILHSIRETNISFLGCGIKCHSKMVAKGLACRNSLILISTIMQEFWCTKEFLVKDLLLLGEWQLQRYFMFTCRLYTDPWKSELSLLYQASLSHFWPTPPPPIQTQTKPLGSPNSWKGERQVPEQCDPSWVSLIVA